MEVMIGDSRLHSMPISIKISESEIMSEFDFALTIQHNQTTNQLSCTIDASLDLFNRTTVDKIAQRFHSMLEQLFKRSDVQMNKPIYELSLMLPDESLLTQSMNNTQVLLPSMSCIHHEFVSQAMEHSQKLAVELDDQSLTYSELLYYVQILALNLLSEQSIVAGDIICQCIERSLSMVR
jgi:non-ribosomal peptide synthetase component F